MSTAPPLPREKKEAVNDSPKKKPWTKPTILVIEDGVPMTESGNLKDPT